jgi:hypothetical protein
MAYVSRQPGEIVIDFVVMRRQKGHRVLRLWRGDCPVRFQ